MVLLYLEDINPKLRILLSMEKTKHLKALRLKKNDIVNFTDGKGNIYKCSIFEFNLLFGLKILESNFVENKNVETSIAISPTKNKRRFDWFLEKAVEIGVSQIYPMICNRSERKDINFNRAERVIISAMEQSLSLYKTKIHPMQKFINVIKNNSNYNKFIAHEKSKKHIRNINFKEFNNKKNIILIGPEGGFTQDEITMAEHNGYKTLLLSHKRLRTETAAIFSAVSLELFMC